MWRRSLWILLGVTAVFVVTAGVVIATWPDVGVLKSEPPETTAFIERYRDRQGEAGEPDDVRWRWVSWDAISPHLKRAVVAAEDMEFFSHAGFSTAEIRAALREAVQEREAPRGASTITQQLAKNLWLSPSRNPLRKVREVVLTRQLEDALGKRRILEIYLNVVEFGPGVYGAEAAARQYFDKAARGLTEYESAQLAASLPRPRTWHPGVGSPSYARYVQDILGRMERATFLWKYVDGKRVDIEPLAKPEFQLPDSLDVPAPPDTVLPSPPQEPS